MSPSRKSEAVQHLQTEFKIRERRACRTADQHRSSPRYAVRHKDDEPRLLARMLELVREHPRFGYRRIAKLLQREGKRIGFGRVYRLWRSEGLKVPKKTEEKASPGEQDSRLCSVSRDQAQSCLGAGLWLITTTVPTVPLAT